jgi:putative ABC transport system substrate-binding protein
VTRRRTFVSLIAAAPAIWPLALRAQPRPPEPHRIGLLSFGSAPSGPNPDPSTGFLEGLRELGYSEGRNLVIEARYADGRPDRLEALAAELARLNLALIVAGGPASVHAARMATSTTPIVAVGMVDPVGQGWAQSLAHPGGNLTGLTVTFPELGPKLLEVLKEARPGLVRIAVLRATAELGPRDHSPVLLQGARALGLELQWLDIDGPADLEPAFERAVQGHAQGMYAPATNLVIANRRHIAELAQRARLPAISEFPLMAQAGFVLSYGTDLVALSRRAASFVDKILKGASPGELPIELPAKFELVANLGAARAIGLTFPAVTLQRADRLIA